MLHEMYQFSFKLLKPIGAPEDEDKKKDVKCAFGFNKNEN